MPTPSKPLKIAILINTSQHPFTPLFHTTYHRILTTLLPTCTLSFFHPILAPNTYPNPLHYDLLVIGGGTCVPDDDAPWVQNEVAWIAKTLSECERLKIVGVCFGHQKIALACGGKVDYNASGRAELGVKELKLTEEGKRFFKGKERLRLHELHKKEVVMAPEGFVALAEGNQVLVSGSGRVLSFQGHPEMSGEIAGLLVGEESCYTEGLGREEVEGLVSRAGEEHDGLEVWRRVLEWVGE